MIKIPPFDIDKPYPKKMVDEANKLSSTVKRLVFHISYLIIFAASYFFIERLSTSDTMITIGLAISLFLLLFLDVISNLLAGVILQSLTSGTIHSCKSFNSLSASDTEHLTSELNCRDRALYYRYTNNLDEPRELTLIECAKLLNHNRGL